MPLDPAGVREIPLGTGGLNLKVDPSMLPVGQLAQADNVAYTRDGTLRARPGLISYASMSSNATAIFAASTGNAGVVYPRYMGRDARRTEPQTAATQTLTQSGTLMPGADSTQAQLPVYQNTSGVLCSPSNVCSVMASTTQVVMAWDYDIDPSSTHKRVAYWGAWNNDANVWDVTPRAITYPTSGNIVGTVGTGPIIGMGQPVLFSDKTGASASPDYIAGCVLNVQFTFGGNSYSQTAALVLDVSTQSVTWFTTNATGIASTQMGAFGGGIYTQPAICGLSTPITGSLKSAYVFSTLGAANGTIVRIDWSGSSAGAGAVATLTGTMGNTRPLTITWQSSSYDKAIVSDSVQSAIWDVATLTITTAATNNLLGGGAGSIVSGVEPNSGLVYIGKANTTGSHVYATQNATTLAGAVATTVVQYAGATQWRFVTQLFFSPYAASSAEPCVWIAYQGNTTGSTQATYLCVYLTTGKVFGHSNYLSANVSAIPLVPPASVIGAYPTTLAVSGLPMQFVLPRQGDTVPSGAAGTLVGIGGLTLLSTTWGATQTAELPPNGTLVNGLGTTFLTEIDAYESGFSYYPEVIASGVTDGGAGNVNGNVQYTVAYRWIDTYGNVHWSAPSVAALHTCANKQVNLPAVPAPNKGVAYWFRTVNNGTTFYQLMPAPAATAVVDNISDTTLTTNNTFIYTTGGQVANDPPPPASVIAVAGQRAYAVSAEQPWLLYYSKVFRAGHPVEWSAQQYMAIAPQTGAITALGTLDDNLVIFKATGMFLLSGDGPNLLLQGNFQGPTPIATAGGCTSPLSVVTTDLGLFYESAQGIMLLGRNLQTQFIGAPLDGYTGTIIGAVANADSGLVRFSDSTNSCVWAFDMTAGRWSKYIYTYGSLIAGSGSNFWVYWLQGANKFIGAESPTASAADMNVTAFAATAATGFITMGARRGWGRLRRLILQGKALTAGTATATVGLAYDCDPTIVNTLTMAYAPGLNRAFLVRSHAPRQTMESLQPVITWSGSDLQISGLGLEIAAKGGVYKLPAAQSV